MIIYIGIDVHSKKTVYVVQEASGREIARGKIPTSVKSFERMLGELAAPRVV